ncbi:MAG TPA: hypothetical protein PKO15_05145 [Fibrobacteria bacterium]|nr:hypothetical protein [Fibrobacteria bacterium]HOX52286.1 hypothetical protein [Fibrobacteria bacterium]
MSQDIKEKDLHAIVAAAVHAVLDEPFRIVSIEPAVRTQSLWNIHGRFQQFESHRLR